MTPVQLKAYVEDSKAFFVNYNQFLDERISELKTRARGESRYVTLWITTIGKVNAQRALNKITDFEKEMTDNEHNQTQESLQKIMTKVTAHMLRAKEMLQKQEDNSSKGSKFVPVDAHHQQLERVLQAKLECSNIFEKHEKIIPEIAKIQQSKSWMNLVLRHGINFVGIRITAHALDGGLRSDALESLKNTAKELENIQNTILKSTNMTNNMLGCTAGDPTPQNELHFQHFPRNIDQPINNFLKLVKENNDVLLTKEKVLEEVKTTFPRPQ